MCWKKFEHSHLLKLHWASCSLTNVYFIFQHFALSWENKRILFCFLVAHYFIFLDEDDVWTVQTRRLYFVSIDVCTNFLFIYTISVSDKQNMNECNVWYIMAFVAYCLRDSIGLNGSIFYCVDHLLIQLVSPLQFLIAPANTCYYMFVQNIDTILKRSMGQKVDTNLFFSQPPHKICPHTIEIKFLRDFMFILFVSMGKLLRAI